ncbi:MAG: PQQ-binding-like beta-propeller repeat protein, partial [Planctomycetota bacterium]
QPIQAFRGMNILTPLPIGENQIFTAAHSGAADAFSVTKNKSGDGWTVKNTWHQNVQGYMSSPVLVDNTIYLHMKNNRFAALDAKTGESLWVSSPEGKYRSMIVQGDRILSLLNTGKMQLIAADRGGFNAIDTTQIATDAWAHLAIQGDLLMVRDLNRLDVYRWNADSSR